MFGEDRSLEECGEIEDALLICWCYDEGTGRLGMLQGMDKLPSS